MDKLKTHYIAFFTLGIIYFLVVSIIYTSTTAYWFDEIIGINISQNSVSEITKIIRQEPHPLGFFLLLKYLPVENYVWTRIIVVTLAHIIFAVAIYWSYKNTSTYKQGVGLGLILYLSTTLWTSVATNIKHDFITTGFFCLAALVTIEYLNSKRRSHFILIAFLCLITLVFGYFNFFKVFALLLLAFLAYPKKSLLLPVVLISTIAFAFFMLFGFTQLSNNQSRITFQNYENSNPVILLINAFTGPLIKPWSYVILAIMTALIFYSVRYVKIEKSILIVFYIAVFIVVDFLIFKSVRVRYISELVFLFTTLAGISVESLHNKHGNKVYALVYLIFVALIINSISTYFAINRAIVSYKETNEFISKAEVKTGILERHPYEVYIRKIQYFPNSANAIPIDAFIETQVEFTKVTEDLLYKEGKFPGYQTNVKQNLFNTGLSNFIYIFKNNEQSTAKNYYYDPEQKVVKVLLDSCKYKNEIAYKSTILFEFAGCEFN